MPNKPVQPAPESEQILVNSFNGLNLLATTLNMPLEDTPNCENIAINLGGAIQKRRGSDMARTLTTASTGISVTDIPFVAPDGTNYVVSKVGTTVAVYVVNNSVFTTVVDIPNAFGAAAAGVRCDYAITSEANPRIIMTTGVDIVRVVTFNVGAGTFTAAPFYSTAEIQTVFNLSPVTGDAGDAIAVKVNGVEVGGYTYTNGGPLTFSTPPVGDVEFTSTRSEFFTGDGIISTFTITFPSNSADITEVYIQGNKIVEGSFSFTGGSISFGIPPVGFFEVRRVGRKTTRANVRFPLTWSGTNHPRTVAIWDGRLYFGGTPKAQDTLVASRAGNFDSFDTGTALADDGFDVAPYSTQEQRIIAIREFRDALFIFCRRAIFLLTTGSGTGSSAGLVTPTSFNIKLISGLGVVSAQSLVAVENTIHFVSDTGVFELTSSVDLNTPYTAEAVSLKIQPVFRGVGSTSLEQATACYDRQRREYWVAIPRPGSFEPDRIYVYNVVRKAWTRYRLGPNDSTPVISLSCIQTTNQGYRVLMVVRDPGGTRAQSLLMNSSRYLDYLLKGPVAADGVTVDLGVTGVTLPTFSGAGTTGFVRTNIVWESPPDQTDIRVFSNGIQTDDFYKVDQSAIRLGTPTPGTVKVDYIPIDNVAVFVDGVRRYDFTVTSTGVVFDSVVGPTSVVEVGVTYTAIFDTPAFQFGTLRERKRPLHVILFADSIEDEGYYTTSSLTELLYTPTTDGVLTFQYWHDGNFNARQTQSNIYFNPTGLWDVANWDQFTPTGFDGTRIKLPWSGTFYRTQLRFSTRSAGTFQIPGYQLEINYKGRR